MKLLHDKKTLGIQKKSRNNFYVNGLKARSWKIFDIEIFLSDPNGLPNFFKNYNGSYEAVIEYPEFASSSHTKNSLMVFEPK